MNQNTTKTISLNGEWKYICDAADEYSFEQIKYKIENDEFTGVMQLPSNWQLCGLNNFSGSVWFIKNFNLPEDQEDIKILKFYGVDYFAVVWLNNSFLGSHKGYFQYFHFNTDNVIQSQNNSLIVKVNSPFEDPVNVWPLKKKLIKGIFNHHDCRPGGWSPEHGQDQNTGGIWNNVELICVKNIYIDQVKITSKVDPEKNTAVIMTEIFIESFFLGPLLCEFNLDVRDPNGNVTIHKFKTALKTGRDRLLFCFTIPHPELWWSWDLGNQNIYNLKISAPGSNAMETSFGIREVRLDDKLQFFINKKRLFLRGTNIIPTQFLSSLSIEKIQTQVALMKTANINAVRIHAHVNRKEFLDECDRQGIIVWQDFTLQWTYNESAEFFSDACEQIRDMVRLHYNHPSIAFWCCHNEPGEQINTLDPFLYDTVLREDNSRIIRKASNYEEHPYDGWYWGKAEHFEAAPMGPLVTEFGAQGIPSKISLSRFMSDDAILSPDWDLWKYHNFQYVQTFLIAGINRGSSTEELIENSQNYQSYLIRTAIDAYRRKKNNGITAIFQFMFIDCWPSITWSVIDYYGRKKKAYEILKTAYQPVYLSVKLRQEKYYAGDKLNIDMWLINDTYEEFDNTMIVLAVEGKNIWELNQLTIKEDSICKYDWEKLNIIIPVTMKKGEYNLNFIIRDETKNRDISYNELKIVIVEKEELNQVKTSGSIN